MKTFTKSFFSLMLAGCLLFGTVACNKSGKSSSCSHNYTQESLVEPTLTEDGSKTFKCSKCGESFKQKIPSLSSSVYAVTKVEPTCTHEGMDVYVSDVYGTYTVETCGKIAHTTYGGECLVCHEHINTVGFDANTEMSLYEGFNSYPRMFVLKDGTWLCGFTSFQETAPRIVLLRSEDEGQTWTKDPIIVSDDSLKYYDAENTAFYQFPNGDILCGYRVMGDTGQATEKYARALYCSISHDNGYTWEYHSCISNAYNLMNENEKLSSITVADVDAAIDEQHMLGVFEPHFGEINGALTVFYADDITPWLENVRGNNNLNYECQLITSKTWDGTSWTDRKIILDGSVQKTVNGVTDFSRDGMPVFTQMHNGWYVCVVEGTYRRKASNGNKPFEVLMCYSKDGENWSDLIEVYVSHGDGTKASGPYVCVTEDDRLVISFQTDEDSSYLEGKYGDGFSDMKVVISDGTPIDKIKGTENFHSATSVFYNNADRYAMWNSLMVVGDTLYAASSANYRLGWWGNSILIRSCKIPENTVGNYCKTEEEVPSSELEIRNGGFKSAYGWYRTTSKNSLATVTGGELYNGTISVDVLPKTANLCGIVFRGTSTETEFWEEDSSYYGLFINFDGSVWFGKMTDEDWTFPIKIGAFEIKYRPGGGSDIYSPEKTYNLKVKLRGNCIDGYVNNVKLFSYYDNDNPLSGTMYGIRSANENVWFGNLRVEKN